MTEARRRGARATAFRRRAPAAALEALVAQIQAAAAPAELATVARLVAAEVVAGRLPARQGQVASQLLSAALKSAERDLGERMTKFLAKLEQHPELAKVWYSNR